jgi:hypothetical protein
MSPWIASRLAKLELVSVSHAHRVKESVAIERSFVLGLLILIAVEGPEWLSLITANNQCALSSVVSFPHFPLEPFLLLWDHPSCPDTGWGGASFPSTPFSRWEKESRAGLPLLAFAHFLPIVDSLKGTFSVFLSVCSLRRQSLLTCLRRPQRNLSLSTLALLASACSSCVCSFRLRSRFLIPQPVPISAGSARARRNRYACGFLPFSLAFASGLSFSEWFVGTRQFTTAPHCLSGFHFLNI